MRCFSFKFIIVYTRLYKYKAAQKIIIFLLIVKVNIISLVSSKILKVQKVLYANIEIVLDFLSTNIISSTK